jgi:hypothetical protein
MSIEAMKQALEALKANDELINGSRTHGGLVFAMEGYYAESFDIDGTNEKTEQAITALRQAIEQAEKTTVDCNTCENRGVLIPLAQETYCENCIYGSSWKKNYYKEKNHEH